MVLGSPGNSGFRLIRLAQRSSGNVELEMPLSNADVRARITGRCRRWQRWDNGNSSGDRWLRRRRERPRRRVVERGFASELEVQRPMLTLVVACAVLGLTAAQSGAPTLAPSSSLPELSDAPTTIRPTLSDATAAPSTAPAISESTAAPANDGVTPSPTEQPTSSMPTTGFLPTVAPTESFLNVSETDEPSSEPSQTSVPSLIPSSEPSLLPSLDPSSLPSLAPSFDPSTRPSVAPTKIPTPSPTLSSRPSLYPSTQPSPLPTISTQPSLPPSLFPTDDPTAAPTHRPSLEPTNALSTSSGSYLFTLSTAATALTEEEEDIFESLMESYTDEYGARYRTGLDSGRINTTCVVTEQEFGITAGRHSRHLLQPPPNGAMTTVFGSEPRRSLQDREGVIFFDMRYESIYTDVENYPLEFDLFFNANRTRIREDMLGIGLNVTEVIFLLFTGGAPTLPPSASPTTLRPSHTPSAAPSVNPSAVPTSTPSFKPSSAPTPSPSRRPSPLPSSMAPTSSPSGEPSPKLIAPTPPPTSEGNRILIIIVGAVLGVLFVACVIIVVVYRRRLHARRLRKKNRAKPSAASRPPTRTHKSKIIASAGEAEWANDPRVSENVEVIFQSGSSGEHNNYPQGNAPHIGAMIPQNSSLVSSHSLVSDVLSMSSDSVHAGDETQLADEFDQYQDQNLEKMRNEVEGSVTNVDGMMSQALTQAILNDDRTRELGPADGAEIEAGMLFEASDWLKRKEGAGMDERRSFMQEVMNKMVASVRHGSVAPEQASRTVHECAALLGLQLAEDIPETLIIVQGMRKVGQRADLENAFRKFGEIESCAVMPNKGFGFVRYKSPKSVHRAMDQFRTSEIVVQDVAVMIKVLKSEARTALPQEIDSNIPFGVPGRIPPATSAAGRGRPDIGPPRPPGPSALEGNQGGESIVYPGDSLVKSAGNGRRRGRVGGNGEGAPRRQGEHNRDSSGESSNKIL